MATSIQHMEGMRGKFEITEGPRTKDEMEHLVKTGGKVRLEVTERQGGMMISSLFREAIIESIVPLKSGEAHIKGQIRLPNESRRLTWFAFETVYDPEGRTGPVTLLAEKN